MLAVFVGRNAEGNFRKTVCSILRRYVDTLEVSSKKVFEVTKGRSKICLQFLKNPNVVKTAGGVVVLNGCTGDFKILGQRAVIFNSSDKEDLYIAGKCTGDVIVCGFSLRDTVTFSSCLEEACVVSLQRKIKRIDGSFKEPFELPIVCKSDDDRYGILAAVLILILFGII